ncbi:hypothetical protein [Motilibacter deserti]|uniref:Uncharacterized protein n=1 Tax=Motilibacter deserti TaxID=2714956 RepID=A0ABX0GXF8_9ACTN|nr:hypothetical protein [Motilibacter deserti]NHC14454.1 hypothetical protein [Motilibacter deserti]
MIGDEDGTPRDELEREVRRVADRLRTLAVGRLGEPAPPWPSRAAAARAAAQALADAAAQLEGEPRRELPGLADTASGDLVAVCGSDLLSVLDERAGQGDGEPAVDAALGALRDVRRAL